MHHKRKRPKPTGRVCKPHKANGCCVRHQDIGNGKRKGREAEAKRGGGER